LTGHWTDKAIGLPLDMFISPDLKMLHISEVHAAETKISQINYHPLVCVCPPGGVSIRRKGRCFGA
jgi:hypothetical protein